MLARTEGSNEPIILTDLDLWSIVDCGSIEDDDLKLDVEAEADG